MTSSPSDDARDGSASLLRVVVADDQTAVRQGLATLLDLLDDVRVVGQAADGQQAVDLVAGLAPDVVLMDLRMPHCDGVAATRRIRAEHPGTQVVVLTTYVDDESVLDALQAGALGYLTKDAGRVEIHRALHAAAAGQALLDPVAQQRLLEAAARRADATTRPGGADADPARQPDLLTPREVEVLRLVAAGLSNRQIARRLVVTEATVKTHINHIFAKAGIRDRAQAVRYAYRLGLVEPE